MTLQLYKVKLSCTELEAYLEIEPFYLKQSSEDTVVVRNFSENSLELESSQLCSSIRPAKGYLI